MQALAARAHTFTYFRVGDVPVGIVISQLPKEHDVRIVHMPEVIAT